MYYSVRPGGRLSLPTGLADVLNSLSFFFAFWVLKCLKRGKNLFNHDIFLCPIPTVTQEHSSFFVPTCLYIQCEKLTTFELFSFIISDSKMLKIFFMIFFKFLYIAMKKVINEQT